MRVPPAVIETARLVRWVWSHPANRGGRSRAVARLLRWQLHKRLTDAPARVSLSYGAKMWCYPGSRSASAALYTSGMADWNELRFLERYLRPGDGFLDVGANVGLYTLRARAAVGKAGAVVAFEPDPTSRRRLEENLRLNGYDDVEVHASAAADEPGQLSFRVGMDTIGYLEPNAGANDSLLVRTERLDDVLGDRVFALAKIDIEGAEPLALRGALEHLRIGNPPVWLMEMNTLLERHGSSPPALAAWLDEQGYGVYVYDADRNALEPSNTDWERLQNRVVIQRASLSSVRERLALAPC